MKTLSYLCTSNGENFTKVEQLAGAKAHSEVATEIGQISKKTD